MDEKEDCSIFLDDTGLDDGTFLENVAKEALEHDKNNNSEN